MDLNISEYWNISTEAPPIDHVFGIYKSEIQLRPPTNSSYVYLGSKENDSQKKVLKFVKCKKNVIERICNEIEIMNMIDHPNILKLDDYFQYNEYVCIVTDYKPLNSLHTFIVKEYPHGMPEEMCKKIMVQMLSAINYLHNMNIWHRDIKPDNFLVEDSDPEHPKVVLADFGYAKHFEENFLGQEFLGTPEFCPPEMYRWIPYNNKVDIYSLGVTLFVMLTGKYPVPSATRYPSQCKTMIIKGKLNYRALDEKLVSLEAIELVKKMCALNPDDRLTAMQALNHIWLQSEHININSFQLKDLNRYNHEVSL